MLSSQTLPELIGFNEAFKDREMPHFGVQTHNISQRGLICVLQNRSLVLIRQQARDKRVRKSNVGF